MRRRVNAENYATMAPRTIFTGCSLEGIPSITQPTNSKEPALLEMVMDKFISAHSTRNPSRCQVPEVVPLEGAVAAEVAALIQLICSNTSGRGAAKDVSQLIW